MSTTLPTPRVLSIQSHVVHGYVGNKSAVFPLQLLGMEVDAINTVQFSNHTGYPSFTGEKLGHDQLWSLIEGLEKNSLLKYTHLLTGYMGSAALLDIVARVAKKLKEINPDLIYVCDPVLGDNGKLYVPPELVPLYRSKIIPLADIITPNQFEVEQLTDGGPVVSIEDAYKRMQQLHTLGASTVVVSSLDANIVPQGEMKVLGSFVSNVVAPYTFCLDFKRVDGHFTGTGDLFAALFMAWCYKTPTKPHVATERAIASIQSVIQRTAQANANSVQDRNIKNSELKLIESKTDIESPNVGDYKCVCQPRDTHS
eukprot:m.116463 g.116463  ORF g.116463 m.116463 type:complete len:312 (+) comp28505_c0_seq1:22-957(+)